MTVPQTSLRGMRVLVTGAGGFIGSHLVEALVREGCQVVAFLHYRSDGSRGLLEQAPAAVLSQIEFISGDIRDSERLTLACARCDVVFHLAALIGIPYSYESPRSYVETNITGTLNILEALRSQGVQRLVHTSTSECYGSARALPMTEAHPLSAQSPYAASKVAADMLVASYAASFDSPVVTLRPFNTYGPRQSARAIVPTIISQALAGGDVRLGNLSAVRDLLFVEDTVAAFTAAAAAPAETVCGRTVHVGSGQGISIGDLATRIMERLSLDPNKVIADPQRVRPENSEVDQLVCDPTLARQLLQWSPAIDFDTGIDRTIAYIDEHLSRYRPADYAR
ncbi:MAG: NAD dependent epimerase/dehydratase [Pseudohongiellaceae bacterium]|jgi:NAD dependent epimerase/dehydratase